MTVLVRVAISIPRLKDIDFTIAFVIIAKALFSRLFLVVVVRNSAESRTTTSKLVTFVAESGVN